MGEGGGAQGVDGLGINRDTSEAELGACGLQLRSKGVVGGTESLEGDLNLEGVAVTAGRINSMLIFVSACTCRELKESRRFLAVGVGLTHDGVTSPDPFSASSLAAILSSCSSSSLLGVVSLSLQVDNSS